MKGLGIFLLIAGALIAACSLLMPTTAPIDVPATSLYELPTRSNVYNLGLLQQQMMVFVIGCAMAMLGGAIAAVGHLGERLLPPAGEISAPATITPPAKEPEEAPRAPGEVTAGPNSEIGWIVGIGAFALLVAMFAIVVGSMTGNSSTPASNLVDLNVTDETAVDNMTAVDAGAVKEPTPDPTPTATTTTEPAPAAEDDSEIGRDNWEGD